MAHDTYSSEELMGLVDYTKPLPLFMLEQYFRETFISHADKISFDEVFEDVRIAPFVTPVSEGKFVVHGGYSVRDFAPAYTKLNDPIKIQQISSRASGDALNTPPNRLSQLEMAIVKRLGQHRKSILQLVEWMAWQYFIFGSFNTGSEEYPSVNLNFNRDAGNTVTLTGADLWTAPTTATPLDDFEDWSAIGLGAPRGMAGSTLIMRSAQWNNLRKTDQFLTEYKNYKSNGGAIPDMSPEVAAFVKDRGSYGAFNIWTVDTYYYDANGAQQYYLPVNKVLLLPTPGTLRAVKMFGKIESLKAVREGDPMVDIWHNHYVTDSGDEERIITHSAPIVATTHVDAAVSATVSA